MVANDLPYLGRWGIDLTAGFDLQQPAGFGEQRCIGMVKLPHRHLASPLLVFVTHVQHSGANLCRHTTFARREPLLGLLWLLSPPNSYPAIMSRTNKLFISVVVTAIAAVSCSGGNSELATAIGESIVQDAAATETDFRLADGEAQCIGQGLVDAIGEDRLEEAGVTKDNIESMDELVDEYLDDGQQEEFFETLLNCSGVETLTFMMAGESATETVIDCVASIELDKVRELLVASVYEDADVLEDPDADRLMSCFP